MCKRVPTILQQWRNRLSSLRTGMVDHPKYVAVAIRLCFTLHPPSGSGSFASMMLRPENCFAKNKVSSWIWGCLQRFRSRCCSRSYGSRRQKFYDGVACQFLGGWFSSLPPSCVSTPEVPPVLPVAFPPVDPCCKSASPICIAHDLFPFQLAARSHCCFTPTLILRGKRQICSSNAIVTTAPPISNLSL